MAKDVNLTIVLPAKIFLQEKVGSVIVPAVRADVDILPNRAPSVFALDFGLLQLLNENGSVKSKYFIQSGMAEVVDNECKVMTQGIISADITAHEAKKRLDMAENEQMKIFYQMILDYQRGVRRRYLRTLQLYSKKLKKKKNLKAAKSNNISKNS